MNLVLIPTPGEREALERLPDLSNDWQIQLCGFGPVAAAANSAGWIAELQPRRVILLGIAGAYNAALPVGFAVQFQRVDVYGIGAGSGVAHLSADALGFARSMPGDYRNELAGLPLGFDPVWPNEELLLTVCSASADLIEAEHRLERHPKAVAEDMEGFGVALSCRRFGIPLTIIRGISNTVGVRQRDQWDIAGAMRAAENLLLKMVATGTTIQ